MDNLIYEEPIEESAEQLKAFFASKIKIDKKDNKIYIKGINYNKFLIRIKDMYDTKSVNNIFTKNYTVFTQRLWEAKKIRGNQRKMLNLEVDLFFASELYSILMELADYYNMNYYRRMAKYIYENTYLCNVDKQPTVKVDTSKLNKILNDKYRPKDFQDEFIRKYFEYKEIYELDGYILSFDQGLGKTFTAACIAELINPEQVIIICLNSLKENWANELRMYFKRYNDEETFKNEVYIHGISKQKYSDKTKYIIVNNESINKIFPLVKNTKSTMIIVDESQNFRNIDTIQTKNMLKLKEITKCKDNLIMSGTPIKANPSEIVPAMIMIDPTFTPELARVYIKSFTSNVESLSNVVQPRFNKTVYRKTKDQVLNLPTKTVTNFQLKYKNEEPYLMRTVRNQVTERFKEILASYKDEIDAVKDEFRQTTLKYSSQDRTTTLDYIKFVDNGQDYESIHDSLYDLYDGFLRQQVYPNIKDKEELKRYKYVVSVYVYLTQKCFFLAMGEIMPKVKAKAFIELYDNNIDLICKMINNNPKKTVIFSTIVEVVNHIHKDLNERDIKTLKITGEVKNRMDIINQFRNDDTVDVLVATSQTIGTGVTLVEASQMFIFGPPYRKADFDQACDRLHRIGQTHPVNIYNVVGSCSAKDVTNRMTDILEWSDKMVSSVLDNITNEQTNLLEYCQFINTGKDLIEHGVYDMLFTEETINEEAIYDSKHKIPIFIVLMSGTTPLSFAIKKFTGSNFTHVAISLNSKLTPMYSFGMKESLDLMDLGFVVNNPKVKEYQKDKINYGVYVMYITKPELKSITERLEWFKEKANYLKFDFGGLIKYMFNMESDNKLNKWFCSRFVMELIGQTQTLTRNPSLYSPQQVADELTNISLVNAGNDLYNYDYKVTEKNMKNIQKGIYTESEIIDNMPVIYETKDEKNRVKGVEIDYKKKAKGKMKDVVDKNATLSQLAAGQRNNMITSTTSTGIDAIDSSIKSRIESFDKEKAKAILESNNIVEEYNMWVEAKIDEIIKIADPKNNQPGTQPSKEDMEKTIEDGTAMYMAKILSLEAQQLGIDKQELRNYLRGTFFYQSDNPNNIKLLLTLRLKYNQKITSLLDKMISTNYKILGFTDGEAKFIIDTLNSDTNSSNRMVKLIKEKIFENRNKFLTNNGECVDLTSLGYGKIFITKGKDFNGLNTQKSLDNNSGNETQAIDGLLQKSMTNDAIVVCHGMDFTENDYNDANETLKNQKKEIRNVYKQYGVSDEDIEKQLSAMQNLDKHGKKMADNDIKATNTSRWKMQPIRSDKSNYYTDMNSFIRELIKEGYKKILIASCNPGSHKLDADIMNTPGVRITYSDYSNLIESVDYDLSDELITEALDGENELIELAESYGIDYNSINIDENTLIEPILEGAMLDKIKEYAKKVLEFIIGLFKKIWQLIKKFLFFVGKKLGIVKNGQAEIKLPKIKGKLVFFENANMKDFEINNLQQLESIAKQSCASIQKELSKRQAIQTKAAKQLNDFVQRMQDKPTNESTHFLSFLDEKAPLNDDNKREKGFELDLISNMPNDKKLSKFMKAQLKDTGPIFATTSPGKDINDSIMQQRLEYFDQKMAKKILRSKDIVKAYNDWIDADLDNMENYMVPHTYTGKVFKVFTVKVEGKKPVYDPSGMVTLARSIAAAGETYNIDKEKMRQYLKGSFYYTTDDPKEIEDLLNARLKYSEQIVLLFTEMLNNNADILEFSNNEAKNLIKRLNNDNTMGDAIIEIKQAILKNRSKFITNNGECIDLTPLGFGKIFITSNTKNMLTAYLRELEKNDKNIDNIQSILDTHLQKAMIYDAIIDCHGMSGNELDYHYLTARIEYRKALKKLTDKEAAKTYSDLTLFNKPLDKNQYRDLFKKRWMMEPVRSDKSDYFIDMDSFVQELINEGYKKILIASCNPGHHALSKETRDMAKKKKVKVMYSDYSNLIESEIYNDEKLRPLAESMGINYDTILDGERELKELAESVGIDYNNIGNDTSLVESDLPKYMVLYPMIKDGFERLILLFKEAWTNIKKYIKFVGQKIDKKDNDIYNIEIGLILPDRRDVEIIQISSIDQLRNAATMSCDSIENEIRNIQSIQVNAARELVKSIGVNESSSLRDELFDFLGYNTVSEALLLNEAVLTSKERKDLPDKAFGLPDKRKFPLNDYDHVIMAIKFFNRCDKKDQEELAKNIIKAMKKYKVPFDKIGKNNKLRNYIPNLNESALNEGIGNLFKYKTIEEEIEPKVSRKDAIGKAYKICDKILNSPKYRSIKKYVKKYNAHNEMKRYLNNTYGYSSITLYIYDVPDTVQGRRDLVNPNSKDTFDDLYNYDTLIDKFMDECSEEVNKLSIINDKPSYTIASVDGEQLNGDIALFYKIQFRKIKIDKKTGKPVNESYPGNPVVGLNTEPMVVDNMMNNAFTSLEVDNKIIKDCITATTKALLNKEDRFYIPYIPYIQESLNIDPNIGFYKDTNGIFVMNENTGLRSPSYKDVDDIDDRTILYITYGELNDTKINDL